MAKQFAIQSVWIVLLVSVTTGVVTWATQAYTFGNASGVLSSKVDGNVKEIARIDTKGSAIVQELKIELTEVRGKVSRNEADLIEIKKTTQKQYETIIDLLTR